jgi:hypothetical protein
MGKLTETLIQEWIKAGQPVTKADGNGLNFTLSAKGTAAWTLRYRFAGRERELTLGRYPVIDLEIARKLTEIERTKIALGRDVCAEKRAAKRTAANAPRIEMLRIEVAKLESDLHRFRRTIEATEIRLNAAREALRIESEGGEA